MVTSYHTVSWFYKHVGPIWLKTWTICLAKSVAYKLIMIS